MISIGEWNWIGDTCNGHICAGNVAAVQHCASEIGVIAVDTEDDCLSNDELAGDRTANSEARSQSASGARCDDRIYVEADW